MIIGLLILQPILGRFIAVRILINIFLTAICLSMVHSISSKKGHAIAGIFLAIVMLASVWLQYVYPNKTIEAVGMLAGVLFTAVVIAGLLDFILKSERVSREIIYAAILLYLLAALMWAFLYTFLEWLDPTSFNLNLSQVQSNFAAFKYYSFVTITTLGYGDIVPVSEVAKAFAITEAVVGQLYLVVAVAWLVGMHVSSKSSKS
ncbi:MAG: potassium channel family protein [Desulfobacterales bacterium]|jgi:hypothetical protein